MLTKQDKISHLGLNALLQYDLGVLQNLALKLFVNHCSRPWITLLVCVSCVIAQALKHEKKGGQTKQCTGNVGLLDASLF